MQAAVSLAVSAQRARDVVARGLRHEPNMRRAKYVARTRKASKPRASPGLERDSTQQQAHTQDGLEFNPPVFLDVRKACAGKKVLIMGLPGAFTPC